METKTKIFGIGVTGLVGSRIVELLSDRYTFQNLSMETGVDITRAETLEVIAKDTEHPVVLHLAAKADVDGCEQDKALGEAGDAWRINVEGTRNVVEACRQSNKKLIYISTDFVFDGKKPLGELYKEDDIPNPLNWYAQTKYEGEKIVQESELTYAILRLAYPYRTPFSGKKDLVQAIKSRLESGQEVKAVTDHLMCPTFVDDFAQVIDQVIQTKGVGLYHAVGSSAITPFQLAMSIADVFSLDKSLISETTREVFFQGRATRPLNLALSNEKVAKLDLTMKTVEEGLQLLKQQSTQG